MLKDNVNIHVFEAKGKYFAFNGDTYSIASLNNHEYSEIEKFLRQQTRNSPEEYSLGERIYSEFNEFKVSKNNAEVQPLSFPLFSMTLLVTSHCNIKCDYCYNDQGKYQFSRRHVMSIETAQKAIDFLLQNCKNECSVSFFGGEPLTQFPLIKKTVEYANKKAKSLDKKVEFHITTNATLVTPEIAKYLNDNNFTVIVSLDGDESTHNHHRKLIDGKGTYALVSNGARNLVNEFSSQERITIRGTYTKQETSLTNSFTHLLDQGYQNISIEPCHGEHVSEYSITSDNIPHLSLEYEKLADQYLAAKEQNPRVTFFHFSNIIDRLTHFQTNQTPCGCSNGYIAVSADGTIYPCHRIVDEKYKLGNVYGDKSMDDLNFDIRNHFSGARTVDRSDCSNCWAKNLCGGSCYAYSIENNQAILDKHDTECSLVKMRIELAVRMIVECIEHDKSFALCNNYERESTFYGSLFRISSEKLNQHSPSFCWFCDGGCTANCTSGCTANCTGGCTTNCTGTCTSNCTGGCQTNRTGGPCTNCEHSCTAGCTRGWD